MPDAMLFFPSTNKSVHMGIAQKIFLMRIYPVTQNSPFRITLGRIFIIIFRKTCLSFDRQIGIIDTERTTMASMQKLQRIMEMRISSRIMNTPNWINSEFMYILNGVSTVCAWNEFSLGIA